MSLLLSVNTNDVPECCGVERCLAVWDHIAATWSPKLLKNCFQQFASEKLKIGNQGAALEPSFFGFKENESERESGLLPDFAGVF